AARAKVGIIARVPLASGLLTGKFTAASRFSADDHRTFNRRGEAFDVGETFSGVPFDEGLHAVEELRGVVPPGATLAQTALAWILHFPEVTCAIPGAKSEAQVDDNARAASVSLDQDAMARVRAVYDKYVRASVEPRW